MRERAWFPCTGENKKEILEALKNEQKYNKKIPLLDNNGEEVNKIVKWDVYKEYIDFWLDNYMQDLHFQEPGKIQSIQLYEYTKQKGGKLIRVKQIVI